MTPSPAVRTLPERPPEVGELVLVRSRRWLVDEVIEPETPGQTCVVRLSCADDDGDEGLTKTYNRFRGPDLRPAAGRRRGGHVQGEPRVRACGVGGPRVQRRYSEIVDRRAEALCGRVC